MGSMPWKDIPENMTLEDLEQMWPQIAQFLNQWGHDKDRFEASVSKPTKTRSSGGTIALTRQRTVDISRVGDLTGLTGSIDDLPFVTLNSEPSLNEERVLTVADPINRTDNGGGSTVVLGVSYTTPNFTLGTANAEGSNAEPVRSDATIAIFDSTTPSGVSTGASHGSAGFAADAAHVHDITGSDIATVSKLTGASSSTVVTLFDQGGVTQSLVTSQGDFTVIGQSGIIMSADALVANGRAAFEFFDEQQNSRSSGFIFRVERDGVADAFDPTHASMRLTANNTPKLTVSRNLGNRASWMDAISIAMQDTLDTSTGIPDNDPYLTFDTTGSIVRAVAGNAADEFRFLLAPTDLVAKSNPSISFQNQSGTNSSDPQIIFQDSVTEAAGTVKPTFSFAKSVAFQGSQNFLECDVAGTTGFALLQDLSVDVLNDVTARQVFADGDNAGVASTTSLTNGTGAIGSTAAVLDSIPTALAGETNTVWLKVYVGTSATYIPGWW